MRKFKYLIALIIAIGSLVSYYMNTQTNPITGEQQRVGNITPKQEIALGLQAAPKMAQQHGGLYPSQEAQDIVDRVGNKIVNNTDASRSPYQFEFHLLADPNTINAFALPGGQVFITYALFKQLENEDQLAGVLGHEVGHVIARHSAQRIAKQRLTQGLTGAAVLAAYDPQNPRTTQSAAVAALIGNMINMKYGREDELESDDFGVKYMIEAGYDPNEMIGVMEILARAGGGRQPEFFSTHPNPENRVEQIRRSIEKYRYN